jgi:hypothetical protein
MKKASLMTAFVLVLAVAVVAQTTTPGTATTPGTTAQGQTTPGANPTSLTGCLSGPANGVYTLRTLTDNRVYTLRSDNPLSSHANHAVTVTGSLDANANATTATSTTAGTGASAATPSNPTAAGANAGTTTTASGNINATGAAAGSTNAQTPASTPVFTVTNISMANESCEAGSSAIGTGTPTTSATGQVSATNATTGAAATTPATTTTTATSGQTANTQTTNSQTTNATASGQTGATTNQTTATGASTSGQSTTLAGAQGTELSGCLMASNRDAGRYFLRTTKGKKFVTEIIPDATLSANIGDHVGHQVRLTGQFSTAAADTTMAQAGNLPQADQPERGKKAHEQDRNTGRQFTASNIEMISASGCPQSSTTPNRTKAAKPRTKGAVESDKTYPKK